MTLIVYFYHSATMGILIAEVIAGAMRDPDMTVDETTAGGMGIRETGMEMIDIVTEMRGMFQSYLFNSSLQSKTKLV